MERSNTRCVFDLTNELHNSVTALYEHMSDKEFDDALAVIEGMIEQLRHVKSNITSYEI